jgi:protein TonB
VHLSAIIGKEGNVTNLAVISGHPLLIPSAMEAVRQWVYQTTLLNGEPVEVITQIDVNYTLSDDPPVQQ